jgi:hypothetical protein
MANHGMQGRWEGERNEGGKADGKVDEEDGEEDEVIHRPSTTGMRWPERSTHYQMRWLEEHHEERRVSHSQL